MFHFDVDLVVGCREGCPMSFFPPSMQGTANWLNHYPNGVEFDPDIKSTYSLKLYFEIIYG